MSLERCGDDGRMSTVALAGRRRATVRKCEVGGGSCGGCGDSRNSHNAYSGHGTYTTMSRRHRVGSVG